MAQVVSLPQPLGQTTVDASWDALWLSEAGNWKVTGPTGPQGQQGDPGTIIVSVTPNTFSYYTNVAALKGTTPSASPTPVWVSGYYTPGDGGGGLFVGQTGQATGFYKDDGGSVIVPTGGDGSAAWVRVVTPDISILCFGAKRNDATQAAVNNVAFQKALLYAGSTGAGLYVPAGRYTLTQPLTTTTQLHMYGDGAASVLDFSAYAGGGGTNMLGLSGSLSALPAVGTLTSGSNVLSFSTPVTLAEGDVVVIHNTAAGSFTYITPTSAGVPIYYTDGEFVQVAQGGVNATSFPLTQGLYSSYSGAKVLTYKVLSPKVNLHDLRLVGYGLSNKLLAGSLLVDPVFKNLSLQTQGPSALEIDRSFRASLVNVTLSNNYLPPANVAGSNTYYGLSISSSQHTHVEGGSFYGYRHGIAQGGATTTGTGTPSQASVPVRDTQVVGALLSNAKANNGIYAADLHPNVEHSAYRDCTIHGGVGLGGKNNGYYNCYITNGFGGNLVYCDTLVDGTFTLEGCRFYSDLSPQTFLINGTSNNRTYVDLGWANSAINSNSRNITFNLLQCQFDLPTSTAGDILVGFNAQNTAYVTPAVGFAGRINLRLEGLEAVNIPALGSILRTRKGGISNPTSNYIIVNHIAGFPSCSLHVPDGSASYGANYFLYTPQRLQSQSGSFLQAISTAGNVTAPAKIAMTPQVFKYKYPARVSATPSNDPVVNNDPTVQVACTNATVSGGSGSTMVKMVPGEINYGGFTPVAVVDSNAVNSTNLKVLWKVEFDTLTKA